MSIDVHLMLSTGDVSYHSLLDNKLNLIVESHHTIIYQWINITNHGYLT